MERDSISADDLRRRLATAEDRAAASEAALRESEARARLKEIDGRDQRYKLLFETIDDGFSVVECFLDANRQVTD